MNKEDFLVKYLKFSGWLEIGAAILFFFMDYILTTLSIPNSLFFSTSAGIMFLCLGFLLLYSAKDIERYLVIILVSCIFRFAMALGPEIIGMITIPVFAPIFIGALIYDIFSATLTLILLKQLKYI